ncbi:RES family NAD+ phosphorylase [Alloacidobacterium dinghuense]|uniref:RES family NAD+ phosphorylase n=1 Tax=Alloacidobacterium dinghuense TaxID=2763107 RepID=A0A7G8BIK1_9BACT|nr:RES family NAD+ phosphorylase [Alloacidobacterium dinghuense]QNI32371.1 RES family NAD+ phosphorylase [Alloacidobacterium dinghuense]
MQVWRLCSQKYLSSAFSGIGGMYASRRWNEKGNLIVYTATSRALAAMEYFVNLEPNQAPNDLTMLEAHVPDAEVEQLDLSLLPRNWFEIDNRECQKIGTAWLKSRRSVGLKVPSVPIRGDWNVLLNPSHPDFKQVSITSQEPFFYDERMFRKR